MLGVEVGYVRVSKREHNPELQRREILPPCPDGPGEPLRGRRDSVDVPSSRRSPKRVDGVHDHGREAGPNPLPSGG